MAWSYQLVFWLSFLLTSNLYAEEQSSLSPDYWTIEGMRSQYFSVGIFFFLLLAIAVFSGIIYAFAFGEKSGKLKKGERILLAWIILGVFVAIGIGVAQLLLGYLM